MDIVEKLKILSQSAKYDASCASSGSERENSGGMGNASCAGICHSWADDGRCISLLKVLFSNQCMYDCAYCVNRKSNDVRRASFTQEELVQLTMNFYKRNYIEGLFLSSAVFVSPDVTMEHMLGVVKRLREVEKFYGYIHLKAIPGADLSIIRQAGMYADRMSVNIELPSESSLKMLAPDKKKDDILKPMVFMGKNWLENTQERQKYRKAPLFIPGGQSTQLIVGATPDNDLQIIKLAEGLYKKFSMKRVYYSAYIHTNNSDDRLPVLAYPPLRRENRLYQADWLLRFYRFNADEILDSSFPYLDEEIDPKSSWALRHMEFFPLEVNRAGYDQLLRVPGMGVKSILKILNARKYGKIMPDDLKKFGVVLKRARFFITCNGRKISDLCTDPFIIRTFLMSKAENKPKKLKLPFLYEVGT